jgi:hypothetical protein
MASRWITHVLEYCKKNGCSYKEGLSKARDSYKPMKGGAMSGRCGHGINPIGLERTIGGSLPELKKRMKEMGHKLSRMVDGRRKMYNKKEIIEMMGGKFSLKQLASDAGKISKKILKTAVPVMAGIGTTIETGNPMAGMAAAKAGTELTNYVLGAGKRRRKKKE